MMKYILRIVEYRTLKRHHYIFQKTVRFCRECFIKTKGALTNTFISQERNKIIEKFTPKNMDLFSFCCKINYVVSEILIHIVTNRISNTVYRTSKLNISGRSKIKVNLCESAIICLYILTV